MTTDTNIIEKLELELAGMAKPCPRWIHQVESPETIQVPNLEELTKEAASNCSDCNGTGVVPLIDGSRQECPSCKGSGHFGSDRGQYDVYFNCSTCGGDGNKLSIQGLKDWKSYCEPEGIKGRGWRPALNPMKVLVWMLQKGNVVSSLHYDEEIYEVLWLLDKPPDTKYNMFAKGSSLEVAILRAAIAGASSMQNVV